MNVWFFASRAAPEGALHTQCVKQALQENFRLYMFELVNDKAHQPGPLKLDCTSRKASLRAGSGAADGSARYFVSTRTHTSSMVSPLLSVPL